MKTSPPQPQSICLLRLSALGDVCNCLALVRALQRAWPETRITWIIGKAGAALLPSLANVEFIVFDKKSGWAGVRDLRQKLASRRFDILLQTQVSARANLLSLMVKADRRIGFDRSRSREGHGLVIRERIASIPFQHQALAFLEFARYLGIETRAIDRRPPIPESALAFAREHQPVAGQAVLLSPASSHRGRNWHAQGYALISDWIVRETGRPVILIGGPSALERQLGQDIEGAASQPLINLIGQDTLLQALAMLDQAACLVAPDSGPVHFAAALGTPVVGLYAATWSKRSGPLGSLEHCVDRFPEAAWKFLGKEPEQVRWGRRLEFPGVMDLITPEMVIERLKPLLDA